MSNELLRATPEAPRLSLRPREAAQALGVSERTLFTWTKNGRIPHVRVEGTILYPVAMLQRWLDEQAKSDEGGEHDPY